MYRLTSMGSICSRLTGVPYVGERVTREKMSMWNPRAETALLSSVAACNARSLECRRPSIDPRNPLRCLDRFTRLSQTVYALVTPSPLRGCWKLSEALSCPIGADWIAQWPTTPPRDLSSAVQALVPWNVSTLQQIPG